MPRAQADAEADGAVADVNDDLERESAFHARALRAFTSARAQLGALGVPVRRPDDYYAEMVKNDAHMRKVKDKLLLEQREADAKVERRKERENKRYGKEVQAEKLRERKAQQKADMGLLQRMKKRGRGTSATDILPDEPDWGAPDLGAGRGRGGRGGGRGGGCVGEPRAQPSDAHSSAQARQAGAQGVKVWLRGTQAGQQAERLRIHIRRCTQPRKRRRGGQRRRRTLRRARRRTRRRARPGTLVRRRVAQKVRS